MRYADTVSGFPFAKDPAVVRFQGRYLMYYTVWSGTAYYIGIAESDDLDVWRKVGEMHPAHEYEARGIAAPGAIVLGEEVHLFYQRYGFGREDAICHAVSTDGLHFVRNPTNPIVRAEGDWNCGRAIDADVVLFDDRLWLYWATRDPDMKVQMLGVSTAPVDSDFHRGRWIQACDASILAPELPWEKKCIEGAAVCVHNGTLYMFYAGAYNNEPQQIGCAMSQDGVAWKRLSDEPLLPNGKPGTWNESESGHPYVFVDEDGRTHLFYQGNADKGHSWYLSRVEIEWDGEYPKIIHDPRPSTC